MEMDEEEKAEEAQKAEDFKRLQEEVAAAKPKGTVRAGPPQIERLVQPSECKGGKTHYIWRRLLVESSY